MGFIIGCLYCSLWFCSILAGYAALYCPLLPLLFVSNRLYRKCTDALFTFWQLYPTFLLTYLCKCEIIVTGDPLPPTETTLLIMNHRTRTDWNFLWPALFHASPPHPTKFILKDLVRHVPGPGWVMQLTSFVYIRRQWRTDRPLLLAHLAYLRSLAPLPFSLLLFPEGTDLTPPTRAKSDAHARRLRLPPYAHVLHPRTAGFVCVAREMLARRQLAAVYDLTLAYEGGVPQGEGALLRGRFPRVVRVHFARHAAEALPSDEAALAAWLAERWREKEAALGEFFATGRFLGGQALRWGGGGVLVVAGVFWTVLPVVVAVGGWWWPWFRWGVVGHSVMLVGLNLVAGGFQNFEIWLGGVRGRFCCWR